MRPYCRRRDLAGAVLAAVDHRLPLLEGVNTVRYWQAR
jgi:hypothetical protein